MATARIQTATSTRWVEESRKTPPRESPPREQDRLGTGGSLDMKTVEEEGACLPFPFRTLCLPNAPHPHWPLC